MQHIFFIVRDECTCAMLFVRVAMVTTYQMEFSLVFCLHFVPLDKFEVPTLLLDLGLFPSNSVRSMVSVSAEPAGGSRRRFAGVLYV